MSTLPKTDFKVERLDDIPLLLEQLKRMSIPSLVDENFKTHGNWQGLSLGWTVTIWLTHILSQADHCLCHVQPWVASHLEALRQLTGIDSLQELYFTDDRLEAVLRYLNKDDNWKPYEQAQGKRLIRVYDLNQKVVRVDSSTSSTFQAENSKGLLRKGVSKDHRPDLAQLKVMLSLLDPLGLPLATQVVSGNQADDPLYVPAIEQVRAVLNRSGVLYVGDCKMAALKTRAVIQEGSDYYLTPLPKSIVPFEVLNNRLLSFYQLSEIEQESKLKQVYKKDKKGNDCLIAKGFEQTKQISTELNGKTITWDERQLIVYSVNHAKAQKSNLDKRLSKASKALMQLTRRRRGKRAILTLEELKKNAPDIIKRHHVEGLLSAKCQKLTSKRTVRGYAGKEARVECQSHLEIEIIYNEEALEAEKRCLGWRVYGASAPTEDFSLEELVYVYRDQYIVERGIGRLKGQPLSLTPLYLQRDEHITGLVRLLSIALCALTLIEFKVRKALSTAPEPLKGLYPGNQKRATKNPSAEILLRAFKDISQIYKPKKLSVLIPITSLQQQILKLLGFSKSIYTQFDVIVPIR